MLTYPAWCSALDREVIESALTTADLPYYRISIFHRRPTPAPPDGVPEPVAVQHVLDVMEVVASRLIVGRPALAHEERQRAAEDLRDQLIRLARQQCVPPAPPVLSFEETVRDALSACAWWSSLDSAPSRRTRPRKPPQEISRLKADREQFVLPLLEELEWTPTGWAGKAGVSPHVTLDYLKGTSTLQTLARTYLTSALVHALKRPDLRLPA